MACLEPRGGSLFPRRELLAGQQ
ncbi:MAG: hypothetical protein HW377_2652, partial [Actinobacteria bacterium]|nr:hypothetical protein [Actinomycetota bacterium]